jgi:hypothetical protein
MSRLLQMPRDDLNCAPVSRAFRVCVGEATKIACSVWSSQLWVKCVCVCILFYFFNPVSAKVAKIVLDFKSNNRDLNQILVNIKIIEK